MTDRLSDGRTESIIAKTALSIASYADALSVNEDRSIPLAVNMYVNDFSFGRYKVNANILSEHVILAYGMYL